jgi:hypothetical protein
MTQTTTYMRYRFIPEMKARQVIGLYIYLQQCNKLLPCQELTEYWDLGIGHCKERLLELGYTFASLREGHPEMTLIDPNGSPVNTVHCP